ncbi:hypothetical protein LSCM4_03495 [Leishmania orientalis]|uniref:Uncharacterized protein n=1 Tax=Leishmania orientalis TaxID=2249476 RepID=A0A836GGW3_9TRYP|nr:hypothetical protein LSCM4_03495 [Leishmania orientalis]
MDGTESSVRVGSADFTSHTAPSYHISASLSNQMYGGSGAPHESRDRAQSNGEEKVYMQHGGEADAFQFASTESFREHSSRSAAALARVEGSVYTPQRTSPYAAAALPSSVAPSTRFPASPEGYLRPFSSVAEDSMSNTVAATVRGCATASSLPVNCGGQVRQPDVVESPSGSEIHCRLCGIDILRSGWEAHQLSALHQRRLRECATACGSSSSLPVHPLTVVVQDGSISPPVGAAGVGPPHRPVISGHGQQASSSAKSRARALAPSSGGQQVRSHVTAAVVKRSSSRPRRCRSKPESASSGITSSIYSSSSSCSSSAHSSSSDSGSSRSRSAALQRGATRKPADLRAISHTTPTRSTEVPAASAAPSSSTLSFALLPVSPPRLSASSSPSGVACSTSAPVKALAPAEAATTVHYVELTEEQQERRRVKELEKQLNACLYRHENRVLAACLRRWYGTMFNKATAPISDAGLPKRRVAAQVVAGTSSSPEGNRAACLPPVAEKAPHIRVTSPSPSPLSATVPNGMEDVPCESGASYAPHSSMNREASAAATDAAHMTQNENRHLNRIVVEGADEGDGRSLARRSNTQQPASVSASVPDCDEGAQMSRPASADARPTASAGFAGAPPVHAGMLVTCGEVESAPAPFLTTCIKSYARVHVTADGRVSPAKDRRGGGEGSSGSEAQDLEVVQTKVSWVVRPASRLAPARSTSAESSDSGTGERGWRSAIRCRAASAGAATATRRRSYDPSQCPVNVHDEEVAREMARCEGLRRCRSNTVQPHHVTKGERCGKSGGLPHLQQPHTVAPSSALPGKKRRGDDGDERSEDSSGTLRAQSPKERGRAGEVHQLPHSAGASGSEVAKAAHALVGTGGEGGGRDGLKRADRERHCYKEAAGKREVKKYQRPASSDSAATAVVPTPSGGANTGNDETEGELREPSPPTSEAARRARGAPMRSGKPLCSQSSQLDEIPRRRPLNAPRPKAARSRREPSHPTGAAKGGHTSSAFSSSSVALSGASKELSSPLASSSLSSLSSYSRSIGSDSDIAELVARLSPSTQQRVWQAICPGSVASLFAHPADAPRGSVRDSDAPPLYDPDLTAAKPSAARRPTRVFVAGRGRAEAQAEEEEEVPRGYPLASPPPASPPLMPQDGGEGGAAAATPSMADILSDVLTGVLGGEGYRTAVAETGERSPAHELHDRQHHRRPRGGSAAVQLPKTLLALHVMSARAASSSIISVPVDGLEGHVLDGDGDAAPPPLEPSASFGVDEERAVAERPSSPSGHPYNLSSHMSLGSGGEWWGIFSRLGGGQRGDEVPHNGSSEGGRRHADPNPFRGAKLAERESSHDNEESSSARLPLAERYDEVFSLHPRESAKTPAHNADEGREPQGTDALGESAAGEKNSNAGDALSSSAVAPNVLSAPRACAPPSYASTTFVSERGACAPVGAPSAMLAPPSPPAAHVRMELCVAQSSGEEACAHRMGETQRHSDAVGAFAGSAHDSDVRCREEAVAEEKSLSEAVGAGSAGHNMGRPVGAAAPAASVRLRVEVALAPNSLLAGTGSEPTASQTGAAALVPLCSTPHVRKVISSGPGAVLPSTNRPPAAYSDAMNPAAKPADAMMPKSTPAQQHVDPFRGSLRSTGQVSEVRPLSLDRHPDTVTLTTIAAIESDGDSSSRRPSLADSSSGVKPARDGSQGGLDPAPAQGAAEASKTALVRTAAPLSAAPWAAVAPCFTTEGADASRYNLPSLEVPVLHAREERGGLDEGLLRSVRSQHLRDARPGYVPFSAPSALLSTGKSAVATPEAFVSLPQLTQDTRPPLSRSIMRLSGLENGISSRGGDTFACSLTRPPEETEAGALSAVLSPAAAGTAHTASCLPPDMLPTTHPYCYAALKGAGGELSIKHDDRIAGGDSVTTTLQLPCAVPSSLCEGLEDSAPKGAFDPSTEATLLSATAAAGLGPARDVSRRSLSSSSHSQALSEEVHPRRRQPHRRCDRDISAASQQRRRAKGKEGSWSKQRRHRDGSVSRRHHRHRRHHRSDHQSDEDSNSETLRSQHRRHHRHHEKDRSSRRGRGRPQEQDTYAAAAPRAYLPVRCALEAAPQRGHSDVDCRDPRYVAQEFGKPLSFAGQPKHPYQLALPSASAAPRASGRGMLLGGKDCDVQSAGPFSDDTARAVRQRRPCSRGSSASPCIKDHACDSDALSRHLHRRPGERARFRGHRYRGKRMPSASVSSTSSSSSRSTSRSNNVSSSSGRAVARVGSAHRGRAAARVGAPPSARGDVTCTPERNDVLAEGTEGSGALVHGRSDSAEHIPETSLQQSMLLKPRRGQRGAQIAFDCESRRADERSRLAGTCADVLESSGPSGSGAAGSGAGSYDHVREKDVGAKSVEGVDSQPPPEAALRGRPAVQETPAWSGDGALFPATSLTSNDASQLTSAPTGPASGRHAPGVQAPCSGAHESGVASSEEVGRLCRSSTDTATTGTGKARDAAGAQPTLPQHGDLFYRDSAGRFHRVSDAELPAVLADEAGRRASPRHAQSPSTSARRPLYVVHNPMPPASAIAGRQQRRAWTITNPTNTLGCGRLNPYCSSCRAKYNLIFVDPQFRPVQWLSAQSAELDQMGDCRIHSGYIFGGGDTESERDALLVQQRLRSKRMAAWPELPHSSRDRLLVREDDLDGPLRQLTPPPQGRFVPIAYEEDTRIRVSPARRQRAPLVAAPARRSFAFSPSSAPLSQLPRRPSPRGVFGDALQFTNASIRDRVNDWPPASSAHLHPDATRSCPCSHDSHHRHGQRGGSATHYQRKQNGSYDTKDAGCASTTQLDKLAAATAAETGQPSTRSHPALGAVTISKRMTGDDATASASASAAASGMPAVPASMTTLCQEERRIKKALKQLLWRDLPKQRGSAEWEHYVRSLSEGLRRQPCFAPSPVPAAEVKAEEVVQPSLRDGAAES